MDSKLKHCISIKVEKIIQMLECNYASIIDSVWSHPEILYICMLLI